MLLLRSGVLDKLDNRYCRLAGLWSAPTASATEAKPSRSRAASSSRLRRGMSAGPSYTSAVYNSTSDAPAGGGRYCNPKCTYMGLSSGLLRAAGSVAAPHSRGAMLLWLSRRLSRRLTGPDLLVGVLAAADAAAADDGHPPLSQRIHLPQHVRRQPQQRLAAEPARLQVSKQGNPENMVSHCVHAVTMPCVIQLMVSCQRHRVALLKQNPSAIPWECQGMRTSPRCRAAAAVQDLAVRWWCCRPPTRPHPAAAPAPLCPDMHDAERLLLSLVCWTASSSCK